MKVRSILLFCLAILMLSVSTYADGFFIEVKGSYFWPSDQYFKEVYENGVSYGGEIGFQVSKRISVWAGGDYFTKKGTLTFTEEETELKIFPMNKISIDSNKDNPLSRIRCGVFSIQRNKSYWRD